MGCRVYLEYIGDILELVTRTHNGKLDFHMAIELSNMESSIVCEGSLCLSINWLPQCSPGCLMFAMSSS